MTKRLARQQLTTVIALAHTYKHATGINSGVKNMALSQAEKSIIFMLIQNNKLSAERNEEIRGDDDAARAEITLFAPEILRIKQEAKSGNELQKAGLEAEIATLDADIATLQSVLEATE